MNTLPETRESVWLVSDWYPITATALALFLANLGRRRLAVHSAREPGR
jgi:hypothetical protein